MEIFGSPTPSSKLCRKHESATAFTLIELMVVVAIIAILIGLLIPGLSLAREQSRRSQCAGNLSAIGKSVLTYAAEWNTYPLQPPPTNTSKLGHWTYWPQPAGVDDPGDPLDFTFNPAHGVPQAENADPMANFWLLVLNNLIQPKSFICQSDPLKPLPADIRAGPTYAVPGWMLNFGNNQGVPAETFSYAFAYPWTQVSPNPVDWWRGLSSSSMPIVADIGPLAPNKTTDPGNSKNHGGKGQNVLFNDGHSEFATSNIVGSARDNIYTYGTPATAVYLSTALNTKKNKQQFDVFNVTPGSDFDVILVPARP